MFCQRGRGTERLRLDRDRRGHFVRLGVLHAGWFVFMCSKNSFVRVMGLFITFRWVWVWIEDINIFSMNFLSIWIMIGICLSETFRNMDDRGMRRWFEEPMSFGKDARSLP